MRFSCTIESLVHALKVVRAAASTRSMLEILQCVLLRAQGTEQVSLSTCNLCCGITVHVDALVEEEGTAATPVEPLLHVLQTILETHQPDERVTLSEDGFSFSLTALPDSSFSGKRVSPSDFPWGPFEAEVIELFSLAASTFKECITQVLFAADRSEQQENRFSCVWMHVEETGVTLAASDKQRIAVRTIKDASMGGNTGVFALPAQTLTDLLPSLPTSGQVMVGVDHGCNALHLRTESIHILVQLHHGVVHDNPLHYGERIEYSRIPFQMIVPARYRQLLLIPTAKLKAVMRKQELLCWSLREEQGNWRLLIERYVKGQKKGESVSIPVFIWGEPLNTLWLYSWHLAQVLSTPGATPFLALGIDEYVPAKVIVRWCDEGEVRQHYSYAFHAEDPYLARLSTKLHMPLSETAQQVLHQLLPHERNLLAREIRTAASKRILLLIEQDMKPTEEDIQRIVREPEHLTEAFDRLTLLRGKRRRERRFDRLITLVAIQSFAPGGITLNLNGKFTEGLHLVATLIEHLLNDVTTVEQTEESTDTLPI